MDQIEIFIAGILEVMAFSGGLLCLYFSVKEKSILIRISAILLLLGSLFFSVVTAHFWFKYYFNYQPEPKYNTFS